MNRGIGCGGKDASRSSTAANLDEIGDESVGNFGAICIPVNAVFGCATPLQARDPMEQQDARDPAKLPEKFFAVKSASGKAPQPLNIVSPALGAGCRPE
jgi:hypothetical protein